MLVRENESEKTQKKEKSMDKPIEPIHGLAEAILVLPLLLRSAAYRICAASEEGSRVQAIGGPTRHCYWSRELRLRRKGEGGRAEPLEGGGEGVRAAVPREEGGAAEARRYAAVARRGPRVPPSTGSGPRRRWRCPPRCAHVAYVLGGCHRRRAGA
jgi:hypothetical protein